jgi:predicted enzyme related to lactoylglutathione lyase
MVRAIYAGIVAEDLERERDWYEAAIGRKPDAAPMDGLYEWHFGDNYVQLVALAKVREIQKLPAWGTRGASSITLVVDDADERVRSAVAAGGTQVSRFDNDGFRTVTVSDPEGNLITFLQRS